MKFVFSVLQHRQRRTGLQLQRATRHSLDIRSPLRSKAKKGDRKKYFDKWTQITGCNRSEERDSGFGQVGQENVWSDNLDTSFILNAAASIPSPAVFFCIFFFYILYSARRFSYFLRKWNRHIRLESKRREINETFPAWSALLSKIVTNDRK